MILNIIDFMLPALLLFFMIGAIAGIVEALIKTWNSSSASVEMLRLRRYAISALVAIVGFFAIIFFGEELVVPDIYLGVTLILSLLIFFILTIIMFSRLMRDTLGYKKRFRWVYLLSVVSIAVLVILWGMAGYVSISMTDRPVTVVQ